MRVPSVVAVSISLDLGSVAPADDLPDLTKTPGVSRPGLSKSKICTIKWGRDQRHVTSAMKDQVFALYGYAGHDPRCVVDAHGKTCEIDHLISRELGGADDVQNLWPEAYGTSPWSIPAHASPKPASKGGVNGTETRPTLAVGRCVARRPARALHRCDGRRLAHDRVACAAVGHDMPRQRRAQRGDLRWQRRRQRARRPSRATRALPRGGP